MLGGNNCGCHIAAAMTVTVTDAGCSSQWQDRHKVETINITINQHLYIINPNSLFYDLTFSHSIMLSSMNFPQYFGIASHNSIVATVVVVVAVVIVVAVAVIVVVVVFVMVAVVVIVVIMFVAAVIPGCCYGCGCCCCGSCCCCHSCCCSVVCHFLLWSMLLVLLVASLVHAAASLVVVDPICVNMVPADWFLLLLLSKFRYTNSKIINLSNQIFR